MKTIVVTVDPGICGFCCKIKTERIDRRNTKVEITESDCAMIQKFSGTLNNISLKDLFMPLTKNPIFIAAEQGGCHPACPVPAAVIKAAEIALELALPKDAGICFEK